MDENPYVRGASRRAVWKRWNSYKQTMDLPGHLAPRLLDVFHMEDTAAYHLAAVAVRGIDVDPKQVVPLLVSLSRREDPELQAEVLESMRKLKQLPEVSIPAFRARLVDSDDAVRVQACLGLAVFREVAREAMNCLQTMLDSPGREDRRRAIKAIRRLQLPAGEKLPLYRRLVVGKDDVLRYHTVLGLFDLGPEAVPAIRELRLSYDMEGTPWMWVIAALTRVDTPESRAALNSIPEEKRQEARRRIAPAYWRKNWVGFHKTN